MISSINIHRATGAPVSGTSLSLRAGDTLELNVGWLDDAGAVHELPAGSTGALILKPALGHMQDPRFLLQEWTPIGSGSQRRYRFRGIVDSASLRADLATVSSADYTVQIQHAANGDPFISAEIPTLVTASYFRTEDEPPPLPLGATESIAFDSEAWGPAEDVLPATRWAGNIHRGGSVHSLRISVAEYVAGLSVMVKLAGVNLLASPLSITGQTQVLVRAATPSAFALTSAADGAKVEVVTTWSGSTDPYTPRPRGLQIDLAMRNAAEIAEEAWDWLNNRLVAGSNITLTPDNVAQELEIAAATGGGGGITCTASEDGLYLEFRTSGGTLIGRTLRAE